jgi:hypothetical protein
VEHETWIGSGVPDELGDARSVRRRHVHDLLVFVALI